MLTTGIVCEYYDWYRHMALESVCALEDINEFKTMTELKMRQHPILYDQE
jgi:hypothetical protein